MRATSRSVFDAQEWPCGVWEPGSRSYCVLFFHDFQSRAPLGGIGALLCASRSKPGTRGEGSGKGGGLAAKGDICWPPGRAIASQLWVPGQPGFPLVKPDARQAREPVPQPSKAGQGRGKADSKAEWSGRLTHASPRGLRGGGREVLGEHAALGWAVHPRGNVGS